MDVRIQRLVEWPEWLADQAHELYERSFQPAERRDFRRFRSMDEERAEPRCTEVIGAFQGDSLLGLSIFRHIKATSFGYLWYLCVHEDARGLGIGDKLYRATLEALKEKAHQEGAEIKGLMFEVERLDSEPHPVYGDPIRRVRFYERFGARLLLGYDYWQPPIPPHGPVPLQLVFHPVDLREEDCIGCTLAILVKDFLLHIQGVNAEVDGSELRLGKLAEITAEAK